MMMSTVTTIMTCFWSGLLAGGLLAGGAERNLPHGRWLDCGSESSALFGIVV